MASQIRFEPSGANGLVASGTTVAAAAERLGVPIDVRCGGKGECTACAVRAVEEPFSLSPMTDAERAMLSESDVVAGIRLGCQAKIGDADCTIHVLDASERPPMPVGASADPSHADASATGDGAEGAASAKRGGWFGFDSWSWTSSWSADSGDCAAGPASSSDSDVESEPPSQADVDDARRRILDAFGELPTSERLAAALEINMKAATDFLGALFDGPLKAGEQALDSLMKQAATVVRDAKQREADRGAPPATSDAPQDTQETDRP